jgi:hypothetical protein
MKQEIKDGEKVRTLDLVAQARSLVESNPCFFPRASHFEFELAGDVLVVRGLLPSFHLKQLLQNVLAKLDGVVRVDNRVSVVSCAGLSSVGK